MTDQEKMQKRREFLVSHPINQACLAVIRKAGMEQELLSYIQPFLFLTSLVETDHPEQTYKDPWAAQDALAEWSDCPVRAILVVAEALTPQEILKMTPEQAGLEIMLALLAPTVNPDVD
jgi:hypothetical protein